MMRAMMQFNLLLLGLLLGGAGCTHSSTLTHHSLTHSLTHILNSYSLTQDVHTLDKTVLDFVALDLTRRGFYLLLTASHRLSSYIASP
jgi:hypothetical protein